MKVNDKKNILSIDFNNYKMITDLGEKNGKIIFTINNIYTTEIELKYDFKIENKILYLTDKNLKKLKKERLKNFKMEILNLLSYNIGNNLKNKITGRKTIYINENIPLIGHTAFGLIDRGTNTIQVRGLTGCNINCPFCSVDEGKISKSRKNDYYVDYEYLINEYKKIVDYKGNKYLEAHLDGQGEPSLYYPLPELVNELHIINKKGSGIITMQTNGVNLTYELIDELEECGLHRINLSINAMDEKLSRALSGYKEYSIDKIIEIAEYIKNSKIHLLIAPLLLPNINDEEFKKVLDFAINLDLKNPQNIINPITNRKDPILGPQLCLIYKFGRKMNSMKHWNLKRFYNLLKTYEKEYLKNGINVNLITPLSKYGNHPRKKLPCPFKVNEVVDVKVVLDGRIYGEVLGIKNDRIIQITDIGDDFEKYKDKTIKVRILRTKDNIIVGKKI